MASIIWLTTRCLAFGQRFDLLELLLDLQRRPALAGAVCDRHADQVFHSDAERARQQQQ